MRIIAGRWRGRIIDAPPGRKTRPTADRVREAWMSALQTEIPGSRVVDLFAGSGALGLELLSRGAEHVTFVERAQPALRTLKANAAKLAVVEDEFTLVRGEAIEFLGTEGLGSSPGIEIIIRRPVASGASMRTRSR